MQQTYENTIAADIELKKSIGSWKNVGGSRKSFVSRIWVHCLAMSFHLLSFTLLFYCPNFIYYSEQPFLLYLDDFNKKSVRIPEKKGKKF